MVFHVPPFTCCWSRTLPRPRTKPRTPSGAPRSQGPGQPQARDGARGPPRVERRSSARRNTSSTRVPLPSFSFSSVTRPERDNDDEVAHSAEAQLLADLRRRQPERAQAVMFESPSWGSRTDEIRRRSRPGPDLRHRGGPCRPRSSGRRSSRRGPSPPAAPARRSSRSAIGRTQTVGDAAVIPAAGVGVEVEPRPLQRGKRVRACDKRAAPGMPVVRHLPRDDAAQVAVERELVQPAVSLPASRCTTSAPRYAPRPAAPLGLVAEWKANFSPPFPRRASAPPLQRPCLAARVHDAERLARRDPDGGLPRRRANTRTRRRNGPQLGAR